MNIEGRLLYYRCFLSWSLSSENCPQYCYKARFQIEFVFRDAKQYTGLIDCQSCNKQATHTQINASFSAHNLLKLADRAEKGTTGRTVISIASWKRRLFNQHLMCRVFEKLGLPMNDEKVMGTYHELSSYGAIAA